MDKFQRAQYIDTDRDKPSKSMELRPKSFSKGRNSSVVGIAEKNKQVREARRMKIREMSKQKVKPNESLESKETVKNEIKNLHLKLMALERKLTQIESYRGPLA